MIEVSDEQKLLAQSLVQKKAPMEAFKAAELPASATLEVGRSALSEREPRGEVEDP